MGPTTTAKGELSGAVDTDANGFARLSVSRGLAALVPPSYVNNGSSAEIRFTGSVPAREGDLCRTRGEFVFEWRTFDQAEPALLRPVPRTTARAAVRRAQ